MATRFDADFAAVAGDALAAFGESVTLTPPVGAAVTVTALLGAERTEEVFVADGARLIRRRTVAVDAADAEPGRGWLVTIAGEAWTVVSTEHADGSWIRVAVERPETTEISREGYRRRS
jgi:hypothetical protein